MTVVNGLTERGAPLVLLYRSGLLSSTRAYRTDDATTIMGRI